MSPARVEDLASIVDTCKPVLVLRNLEVDPAQTLGPLLHLHQLFPILLPWFRPTPGSATNCGSSVSKSCTKSTVSCHRNVFTCKHWTKPDKVAKVQILCARSGSIVILLPPKTPTTAKGDRGYRVNQRYTIKTKLILVSNPRACAQTAMQRMMVVR